MTVWGLLPGPSTPIYLHGLKFEKLLMGVPGRPQGRQSTLLEQDGQQVGPSPGPGGQGSNVSPSPPGCGRLRACDSRADPLLSAREPNHNSLPATQAHSRGDGKAAAGCQAFSEGACPAPLNPHSPRSAHCSGPSARHTLLSKL